MIQTIKNCKALVIDLDGTLCEYKYNGCVGARCKDPNCMHPWSQTLNEFLFADTYKTVRPLKTMQKFLSKLDSNKIYVLSAIITGHEVLQKIEWLNKHFPFIKNENMMFIADLDIKFEALQEFAKHKNLNYNEIVYIDDIIAYLRQAEEAGFKVYHVSSFIQ